ncbi:MAG: DUF3783 domain-containing protein [Candidatus Thermoplasmatota archaeon]|jgi:hypothetical protein|nr:DUF3783 domain-containing protein [Candidatus Thermoplasmatota archaeon]
MDELGLMLYGFSRDQSIVLKGTLEGLLGTHVTLISGSGKEDHLLLDVLEKEDALLFEERDDPRVVMFLGFDGPQIHTAMDNFPRFEGKKRPIFCTPTEENINWKLSALLKDLMEEREHFRKLDEQTRSVPPS